MVLSHIAIFVCQRLLRMCEVTCVGCCLRPNVAKLKADLRKRASLVEARVKCELAERLAVVVLH